MITLSDIPSNSTTKTSNNSSFSLYLGSRDRTKQTTNQKYLNSIYISNLEDLIQVCRSYSHTTNRFNESRRGVVNWLGTDCLIVDIDNKESESESDWITISAASKLIGTSHYIIPSKSHLKWKTNISDLSIRKEEGDSPRPRFHIYIPISRFIDDFKTFQYFSHSIKELFTINGSCLIDTSVSGRSGSFFSSPNLKVEDCILVEKDSNFEGWIQSVSKVSLEDYEPKKSKKKTTSSSQRIIKNLDDENLKFLGRYRFLLKDYPNNNGTYQVQHLGEKSPGGYFYDSLNQKIWKYDAEFSGESWTVYEFLKEFSPNEVKEYEKFRNIQIRDEKQTVNEYQTWEEVKPSIKKVIDTFFDSGVSTVLGATEGSGKTLSVIEKIEKTQIMDFYKRGSNKNVGVFVPTNHLADEWFDNLIKQGIRKEDIVRIAGRSHKDNCIDPDIDIKSISLREKGLSTTYSVCSDCPLFKKCNYYQQFENYRSLDKGKIFVMVRNYLTIDLPDFINTPSLDRIVIDENPTSFMTGEKENITVNQLEEIFEGYRTTYSNNRLGWNPSVVSKYETFLNILKGCNTGSDLTNLLSEFSKNDLTKFSNLYRSIWSLENDKKFVNRFNRFDSSTLFFYLSKLRRKKSFKGVNFAGGTFTLLSKKRVIEPFRRVPKLILDSNVREEKSKILSDIFETNFESFNFKIRPNVDIHYVNKTFSKMTLESEDFCFEKEIGDLVSKLENKKVLFFIRQNQKDNLRSYLKTTNLKDYEVLHQGGIRGLDRWKDFECCVYIGWFLEPINSVIDRYNSIYPDQPFSKILEENESLNYDERIVQIHTLNGTVKELPQKCFSHPDKEIESRLNELLKQTLIDEMSQAISRLRFIHSKERKEVYILNTQLTDFPVKDIYQPKKFRAGNTTELDNRLNTLLDRTDFNNDVLVLDYKVVGDLFKNNDSFKMWKNRNFGVTNGFINLLIGKSYSKLKLYKFSWGRGKNEYYVFSEKSYTETKNLLENHYLSILQVKSIREVTPIDVLGGHGVKQPKKNRNTEDINKSFIRFINKPKDSISLNINVDVSTLNFEFENRFVRDDFG